MIIFFFLLPTKHKISGKSQSPYKVNGKSARGGKYGEVDKFKANCKMRQYVMTDVTIVVMKYSGVLWKGKRKNVPQQ